MENCRHRQSSLVSVLLPTGGHNPSVSAGDGDSAAGIDSWQRVVKQRYLVSPSRFETPRSVPSLGAGRWRFFNCSTAREAVVSLYRLIKIGFDRYFRTFGFDNGQPLR